ncbi:hypothetical protein NG776_03400 [Aliarcobacter cryaerophilus]|uniref:hypothetical protein n=1 Tax=Aliarcobacter cryaerophilus TaxID=28198 RepID=UPI003DA35626
MNATTLKTLKNKLISTSQALASQQSSDHEVFVYNDSNLDKVFEDYENIKIEIKNILENIDFLIDRHKISAFFMSAILKNKPIIIKTNQTDISDDDLEFVINTNLAILFANFIIRTFYKEINKKDLKVSMPDSSSSKAYIDQLTGLIKIYKERLEAGGENINILLLSISHIFFLLEKYSEAKQGVNI